MFYLERNNDPDILSFKLKKSIKFISYILLITGILFFLTGALILSSGGFSKPGLIITGIGISLISASMLAAGFYKKLPAGIKFNLPERIIHIYFKGDKDEKMSFDEIENFSLGYFREQGYIVSMHRKNGSYWELLRTGSRNKAEKVHELLTDKAGLSGSFIPAEASLPGMLMERDLTEGHVFLWKENLSFKNIFWTVFLSGGAALTAAGITSTEWSFYGPIAWIALIFIALTILMTIRFILSHLIYSVLFIGPAECSYGFTLDPLHFSARGWRKKRTIRTTDVSKASYSIDPVFGSYQIIFFDRVSEQLFDRLHSGDIGITEIPSVIAGIRKIFSIKLPEWDTWNIFNFERILNRRLENYKVR